MVRDSFGHPNISATSIYLQSEDEAHHDATSTAHRASSAAFRRNIPKMDGTSGQVDGLHPAQDDVHLLAEFRVAEVVAQEESAQKAPNAVAGTHKKRTRQPWPGL